MKQKGYIAIATVLVIAAAIGLIGVTVSLSAINEAQISFANIQSDQSLDLVEGCAADTLLYLSKNDLLPSTITLPSGSCTISVEAQSGNDWTFLVSATFSNHSKKVRIQANRGSTVTINSWQEVE